DDAQSHKQARRIFDEQIGWAVDAGVDFIVGETYSFGAEALLALEAIKRAGKPAVITLSVPREGRLREGWTAAEACRRLQDHGADVVGMNCARGPATTLPLLREIRAAVTCPSPSSSAPTGACVRTTWSTPAATIARPLRPAESPAAMGRFFVKHLLFLLLTLFVVSFLVFTLNEFSPGAVARKVLGAYAT